MVLTQVVHSTLSTECIESVKHEFETWYDANYEEDDSSQPIQYQKHKQEHIMCLVILHVASTYKKGNMQFQWHFTPSQKKYAKCVNKIWKKPPCWVFEDADWIGSLVLRTTCAKNSFHFEQLCGIVEMHNTEERQDRDAACNALLSLSQKEHLKPNNADLHSISNKQCDYSKVNSRYRKLDNAFKRCDQGTKKRKCENDKDMDLQDLRQEVHNLKNQHANLTNQHIVDEMLHCLSLRRRYPVDAWLEHGFTSEHLIRAKFPEDIRNLYAELERMHPRLPSFTSGPNPLELSDLDPEKYHSGDKPRVRCPRCHANVLLKNDGTLQKHACRS